MVNSLDLALLQAEIDVVMGPLFGSPARFSAVDPELVDVTKYHNDLVAAGGSVTALKADPGYDNLSYRQSAPSLDIAVTGLTHNPITGADPFADKVDVRLGDTSSVPQLDSVNGTTFISNVVPGTWPLEVTLPAGVSYQILGTSSSQFNNASLETLNNGRVKIKAEVEITGATNLQLNLNRVQPVVSSISTQNGTRGSTFVISGENFHTQPGGNQVIFDGATDFPAEVVSATATELVVKVPQVDVSGNYTVQVGYSKPVDADTGDLSAIQASDPHLFNVTTVWYVKHDGVAGANGDKWEVAVPLYDALARAGNNDEIWIQQGVYKPSHILVYDDITETYSAETPADPRAASFTLANNIKLLGGFAGTELSSSERNPQTRPVVFDGDLLGNDGLSSPPTAAELNPDRTERSDNSYNVVTVFGQNTVIDGITITGGNASDLTDDTYLTDPEGCDPVNDPDNCYIYETQYNLRKRGGGLVNQGDVTLRDVTIRFNSARGDGGGIFAQSNNPGSGLHLTSSKYVDAGGMTEYDGNRTGQLSYNLIEDNLAGQNGGGIYDATAGRPGATILRRNRAGNDGGGMYAAEGFEGSNELSDFIFEANHADRNGGGYTSYRQNSLNFRRSVFFNNSASNFGGGVYYEGGGGEINGDSNVFANNTALKGGGFYYEFMNLVGIPPQFIETKTITHASFVNNQATDASGTGGGAFYLSGLRSINFVSSIFFGNDVARGGDNIGFDFSSSLSDAANREALVKHDGSPAGTGFINAVDNGSNLYGRTNAAEIFSNINALPGSLGWASADDGLRPPSNSPAKGIGVWADDRRDLRGGLRLNPSTIGAYEAHEGP
ncbi:MAG: hypothetical protein CVV27_14785 [Candidatus Melainabacteria bacterium HGW-Melainabacteria-1]|nr:MAG: hypothetical protein CVV27_14785 [Candidatus Melainabacteria bacterium HGW-Melainabacteria-1]